MPSGAIVNTVTDTVSVILDIFDTAEREIAFLVPPSFLSLASTFGTIESAERFVRKGGVLRGITTVLSTSVEAARMRLTAEVDLRHSDHSPELFMFVGDARYSVSAINVGVRDYTLDTPVTAFWSENPVYAEYLLTVFERAWSESVPAAERLIELSKHSE